MEIMVKRLDTAKTALEALERALPLEPIPNDDDNRSRDAAILRFIFTFEAIWKAAQTVLRQAYGQAFASPKEIVRACLQNGLINRSSQDLAMQMADDRNLAVHTYNELLAEELAKRISSYTPVMRDWLLEMYKQL